MIGKTIAQYEILEKLGEGGMGVVYRARDTRLERDVALKFLRSENVRAASDRERFFREARVLAALDHPNICTVYDLDEVDGTAYIAMAFLKGKNLHQFIKGGPIAVEQALDIVRQVATGLQAAHEENVVHRDIKSHNVVLTTQGIAKILDFGLARLSDRTTLTREGTTMGTICYMSPEQSTGARVDHRTDIWAAGVLLYELVSGTLPFYADFDQAVIYLILNEDPKPLHTYREDVPDGVQAIVDRALAKDVDARFQSAAEMIDAIDNLGTAPGRRMPTTTRTPETAPSVQIDPNLVAVFDFANRSGSAQDNWLSGGIAETLTADLKRIHSLRLVARQPIVQASSGLTVVGGDEAVRLGRAFSAGWVVWGDYQRLGDAIQITANFSRTSTGEIADTSVASGPMGDIFKLQHQIVSELAEIVDVKLTTSELEKTERVETGDEKAYEYYARARHRANQMGINDFDETRKLYEKAIELDPNYALAYSGLANLHLFRHIARADPEALEEGRRRAEQALEIDPDLAEPHLWLGYALGREGDLEGSLKSYRTALDREDDNPWAHYFWGASKLVVGGGWMEAHDSYSADVSREGITHLHRAVELNPGLQPGFMFLGAAYALHGQYDKAMVEIEKAVDLERGRGASGFAFVGAQTLHGNLFFRLGELDKARLAYRNSLDTLAKAQHVYRDSFIALTYCGLGDVEYALRNYDKALKHYGKATEIAVDESTSTGMGFHYVHGCAGMASSYSNMGVYVLASENMQRASDTLRIKEGFSFAMMWGGSDAEANYDLACAYATLQRNDDAIACLEKATVVLGWRDLPTLEANKNLQALVGDPRMVKIVGHLRQTTPLP